MALNGTSCILIILFIRIIQQYSGKMSSILVPKSLFGNAKYFMLGKLFAAVFGLLLLVVRLDFSHFDLPTLGYSAAFGMMLVTSTISSLYAMKNGTMALSSLFSTAGLIVPCIAGIFMYNIRMSLWQWVGVALFFACSVLLIGDTKRLYKSFSVKTIGLLIVAMLSNGAVMLLQTMFTKNVENHDVATFSFLGFLIPGIVLGVFACLYRAANPTQCGERLSRKIILFAFISAVAVFFVNLLATTATETVDPVILFTFINGGNTIIAALVAAISFHEKITLKNGIGLLLGIVSLIMVKAFQPA